MGACMEDRPTVGFLDDKTLEPIERGQIYSKLHGSIGAIVFRNSRQEIFAGSGVLISSNLVLTAAQNLFDKQQSYENTDFRFYLEMDKGSDYFQIESWRYPEEFKTASETTELRFNYALLKIKERGTRDMGNNGFLKLSEVCQICLLKKSDVPLQVYGFSFHENQYQSLQSKSSDKINLCRYGLTAKNRITSIQPSQFRIKYAIQTQIGLDGCPVVMDNNIIAIHSFRSNADFSNSSLFQPFLRNVSLLDQSQSKFLSSNDQSIGRLLTPDLMLNLQGWSKELGANSFQINDKDKCEHLQRIVKKQPRIQSLDQIGKEGGNQLSGGLIEVIQPQLFQNQQDDVFFNKIKLGQEFSLQKNDRTLKKFGFRGDEDTSEMCLVFDDKESKLLEQQLSDEIVSNSKLGRNFQISESVAVKMNNGLKELDLTSKDAIKLTSKHMVAFSKLKLSNLTDLKLQNNRIKDQGLSALCQNEYPSLQKISLDDNGITISGVKHILFSKWKSETKVSLYAVESVEHGYQLNVGESIPFMKKIIEKNNANQMDSLISANKSQNLTAINLLLITPLDEESPKEMSAKSMVIEERYRQQSSKNPLSLATLMLQLKQFMGNSLHFSKTPDIKSKLTSKIIFTGMAGQRVKFSKTFKHLDNFKFSDFKDNHKKLQQFEKWYFQYLRNNYGVDTTEMTLEKVIQGSIKAVASDNSANILGKSTKFFYSIQDSIQGFFENLQLKEDEFDECGNYSFPPMENAQIQKRGGFPYYQPVLGKRFGIKIKDLYDNSNNDWLMMNGNKNEWAAVFHGINYPTQGNKLRSIMNGRGKDTMLQAGARQACAGSNCLRSGELVGKGIYVSPYFLTSLLEYSNLGVDCKYHIVLQCRAKPSSIKISSSRPDYCVINNSSDLRPYGVILFTDSEIAKLKSQYSSPQDIHKSIYRGQQFTKQSWNNKYKQAYDQFQKR